MDQKFLCGASVQDITPTNDMLPMSRGTLGSGFVGVVDPLRIRAIALDDGTRKVLLVSFDLGAAPDPIKNVPLISKHTGIPEDNIFLFGTHAHAAPMVGRIGPTGPMTRPNPEIQAVMERYEKYLYAAMYKAIDCALADMRPAKVGSATGKSYINVNRNQDYVVTGENGERVEYCSLGFSAEGPSDKTLFVMRFDDSDGKPIAFFVNYPVHCVVMHANDCFNGAMGISGDIAGCVSGYMEDMFEGAVAMWTSGAAGDQNPIMMNNIYYPDPETGKFNSDTVNGGDTYILRVLSTRHFADIQRVLEKIDSVSDDIKLDVIVDWSLTPGRDLEPLDPANPIMGGSRVIENPNAAPYDVRLQMLKIGNTALLGISGELYTSFGLHLKEISPLKDIVIVTHCSSHMTRAGYIYDDDGIARKALHYGNSRILPGYVKDSLSQTMLRMFDSIL